MIHACLLLFNIYGMSLSAAIFIWYLNVVIQDQKILNVIIGIELLLYDLFICE